MREVTEAEALKLQAEQAAEIRESLNKVQKEKGKPYVLPGDLVLFFHPSEGRIAHVGFVTALNNGDLSYVSGNTNSDGSRNGIGVFLNKAQWADMDPRTCFARLPF